VPNVPGTRATDPRGKAPRDPLDLESSPAWANTPRLTNAACTAVFERAEPGTVGVEEELMLISPKTLDLAPANEQVLGWLDDAPEFQRELRASQIEIVTPVCRNAAEIEDALAAGRHRLLQALAGRLGVIAAGTHPFATDFGELTDNDRYRMIEDEYRWAARRSVLCGLHVHVSVGGAERTLAVYNALRSFLPEVAAIAANSPYFHGEDTELCSIRPKLLEALSRTGIPPAFSSWDEFVGYIDWGRRGGLFPDSSFLWWDLRPNVEFGTLELRAADAQTRVEDAAAIAALVQTIAAWLGARVDRGAAPPVHASHRIAENAWRAVRSGVRGELVDLETGKREATRARIGRLLETLEPTASDLGNTNQLEELGVLLAGNGADRQRYVAERDGVTGLVSWLAAETAALPVPVEAHV
jgi:carboxylate-amine ligase